MRNLVWQILGKFLALPFVTAALIAQARKTPFTHLRHPDGRLYMARWWLFNGWGEARNRLLSWIPFSIRVHYIATADEDRELHDHPWPARTFILKGWYKETRLVGSKRIGSSVAGEYFVGGGQVEFMRKTGDTATLDFCEFHRISEISPGGVYTLFLCFGWAGDWGFLSPTGRKVWWRDWLNIPKPETAQPLQYCDVRPDADDPAVLQAENARAHYRKIKSAQAIRETWEKENFAALAGDSLETLRKILGMARCPRLRGDDDFKQVFVDFLAPRAFDVKRFRYAAVMRIIQTFKVPKVMAIPEDQRADALLALSIEVANYQGVPLTHLAQLAQDIFGKDNPLPGSIFAAQKP